MVQIFVETLLTIVMAVSAAVGLATPASSDGNPSEEAKGVASQISEYVKENHPAGEKVISIESNIADLGVSDLTPDEPKADGQLFGDTVSDEANGENGDNSQSEENSEFGETIANSQTDAAKAGGKAFGTATANLRKP